MEHERSSSTCGCLVVCDERVIFYMLWNGLLIVNVCVCVIHVALCSMSTCRCLSACWNKRGIEVLYDPHAVHVEVLLFDATRHTNTSILLAPHHNLYSVSTTKGAQAQKYVV